LASYTTRFGQKVNPAFKDKVGFTDAGLQNSSIFIRNVTEEDEGCYLCLFNADPEGALIGETCLQVYAMFFCSFQVLSLDEKLFLHK
uniref:Immunoglobulin V-set domain-containing protein n=1 Tax=Sparus aurata TaxID=8175 RepID=A0A671XCK7_SPAAU